MTKLLSVAQGVAALKKGQIIAYPTEAVFGLGCCPQNNDALGALVKLKERSTQKGMIIIASRFEQLLPYIDLQSVPLENLKQIEQSWPGPFTWVFPASKDLNSLVTGQFTTVAVRVTAHPEARALSEAFGAFISTSANISSNEPLKKDHEVAALFQDAIAGVVQGEVGALSKPTTIIDAITGKVYRE